ncbi:hypothetical protein Ddye_013259 [Dipteronia dyeriana]|uniref:Uncharacterized protein n=1 Tax=Dipteronia dyeriana TaxID=168575 RepID=A0AAD9X5X7_9ROSI|nr:hypothetical protein Ddye_013259 [Dipteronia dyeriana]
MAVATTPPPSNSFVLLSLFNAIENEDIQTLKSLLSDNPEILDLAAKNWPQNPLILAWKLRKFLVIKEIGIWKPEFAVEKMQEGFTILHLACIKGDVDMVRALVRLDSQLCLLKDDCHSMTLLQLVVKHDHGDVKREILLSCPYSIEKLTSRKETVFHLATIKHQSDAFEVVKLLLPESNRETGGHGFMIQVNSNNKKGETALDLYYQIPDHGLATLEIGHLLREAGGREGNLTLTNLMLKLLSLNFYDFEKWLKMKLNSNVLSPSKKNLPYLKQLSGVQTVGIASTNTAAASNN